MVIAAELEIYHSRPVAPTRRVALGRRMLPIERVPGPSGMLLGAIVARAAQRLDEEMRDELEALTYQLEHGQRIPQPRLRHRLQTDRIGLNRSLHRLLLLPTGEWHVHSESRHEAPAPFALGAVYAAGEVPRRPRAVLLAVLRRALAWQGGDEVTLLRFLSATFDAARFSKSHRADPVAWALSVLGVEAGDAPPSAEALRRNFRDRLRQAHPDVGGAADDAAERIAELLEAKRILLS